MRIAIYPGTFDPVTNGHLDILERALTLFDKVIIAIASDSYKNSLFTTEERMTLLHQVTDGIANVSVEVFKGLLVDYCAEQNANAIIRGLRAVSDFEYEFQMALMNKKLKPNVETVFLMSSPRYSYISSSIIKQVASLGGCTRGLVPEEVTKMLVHKFGQDKKTEVKD